MPSIDPTSALLSQTFTGPPPSSPVSQMVLAVRPLAHTPTSHERIQAEADAMRNQGIEHYA